MSLLREKHKWVSWTLIYVITLGCLLSLDSCLEKVIHAGWLAVLIILLPFSLDKLGMIWIKNHGSSWMKRILNSFLFCKIILVSSLFLWTFCENNQRFFRIMNSSHPQLSRLICLYFHEALDTFLYTILC